MAYLSEKIIFAAFKDLSNLTDREGKKATEVVSALRYLLATSKLMKKSNSYSLDLSISSTNRDHFISSVGEIVSLSDGKYYSNNFFDEFLSNSDYAVRNNFLTTRLKINADYPGRPAPVQNLTDNIVRILPDVKATLEQKYHNFKNIKVALSIWLMRNTYIQQIINNPSDLFSTINLYLSEEFEEEVAKALSFTASELYTFLSKYNINTTDILNDKKASTIPLFSIHDIKKTLSPVRNFSKYQATNKIYFGCPGTGKSYKMDKDTEGDKSFETTFHPEYDYAAFVGSYKPKMADKDITYTFTPQIFTKAYVYAYQNPHQNIVLKIEEINRGNCAMIFGDIFQLLDRHPNGESKYEVTPDADLAEYLEKELGDKFTGKLKLPSNLSIYATMNTSDQSLFPMDSAFKRRWEWEYVPIDLEKAETMYFNVNDKNYNWKDFLVKVNAKIYALTQSEDKQLGTFFVSGESEITETQFKTKVMFYLWFDVFKNEIESEHNIFRDTNNKIVTFSDLFKKNDLLEEMITRLELTPTLPEI